jgi:hypothetical protein
VAHATHALLAAWHDLNMPLHASEVCIYDSEALSVKSTAAALREAQNYGLVFYTGQNNGRCWIATNLAHELRRQLEDRFLAETDKP